MLAPCRRKLWKQRKTQAELHNGDHWAVTQRHTASRASRWGQRSVIKSNGIPSTSGLLLDTATDNCYFPLPEQKNLHSLKKKKIWFHVFPMKIPLFIQVLFCFELMHLMWCILAGGSAGVRLLWRPYSHLQKIYGNSWLDKCMVFFLGFVVSWKCIRCFGVHV